MKTRMMALLCGPLLCAALSALPPDAEATTLRSQQGPYELQVLVGGAPARTFSHGGETYVLGHHGDRYTLRIWNRTSRRVEVVATVDGRDVIDGKPGDFRSKRGYVVPAWGYVDIDGWRLSSGQVAAFRFSSVARSYAARTGGAREVGVIGVAVFPERAPPRPVYIPRPRPYYGYGDGYRGRAESRAAAAPPASEAAPPSGGKAGPGDAAAAPRGDALVERERDRAQQRPGLGTAFGEAVDSAVQETEFVRQHPTWPAALLGVRYNDREGLLAMGIDVDGPRYPDEVYVRRTAEPFPGSDRPYAAPPPGWEY